MVSHEVRHKSAEAEQLRQDVEHHIANGGRYEKLSRNATSVAILAFNNGASPKLKAIFSAFDDEE